MTWGAMKLSPVKLLVATLVCAIVATVVNGVYTGPRYGKRDSSGEMASRVLQRNSGIRNIQARSAGERRFYPGTRFGGKRTYWPTQFQGPSDDDERSVGDLVVGGSLPLSSIPYDCVYIPFVGVRCTKPGAESPFYNYNEEGRASSVVGSGVETQTNNNENGNSPAVTGIDP